LRRLRRGVSIHGTYSRRERVSLSSSAETFLSRFRDTFEEQGATNAQLFPLDSSPKNPRRTFNVHLPLFFFLFFSRCELDLRAKRTLFVQAYFFALCKNIFRSVGPCGPFVLQSLGSFVKIASSFLRWISLSSCREAKRTRRDCPRNTRRRCVRHWNQLYTFNVYGESE